MRKAAGHVSAWPPRLWSRLGWGKAGEYGRAGVRGRSGGCERASGTGHTSFPSPKRQRLRPSSLKIALLVFVTTRLWGQTQFPGAANLDAVIELAIQQDQMPGAVLQVGNHV